jgi:hypothetical protein
VGKKKKRDFPQEIYDFRPWVYDPRMRVDAFLICERSDVSHTGTDIESLTHREVDVLMTRVYELLVDASGVMVREVIHQSS